MDEPTDETLMQAYLAGDRAAFGALFHRYGPRLRRMLARELSRSEDVEDLVQQTFLQLHRARRDFRPGAKLRPWIYTIALNLRRQHFRRAAHRHEISKDHEGADERTNPETGAAEHQLRQTLLKLPPDQREAIVLHWFEGLSFGEVAEVVGASVSAVKVRAHRGYTRLRELLGGQPVTGAEPAGYTASEVKGRS